MLDISKADFMRALFDRRILLSTGVRGVHGRGAAYLHVTAGVHRLLDAIAARHRAEAVSFPPVIPRSIVRRAGYMENFPQLCGSVHAFDGGDGQHLELVKRVNADGDWTEYLSQTDVVLSPATCYPLYPTLSGKLPAGGRVFDMLQYCFRHEPSDDPARMLSFQMRENVRLGSPADVQSWRAQWIEAGRTMFESLDVPFKLETASDPFFGRGGQLMKQNQEAQALKFELLVPVWSESEPTAVTSFNYHQEHFGQVFDIRTAEGECAHTACIGIGIDRIVISLFKRHGFDPARWPDAVRARMWG